MYTKKYNKQKKGLLKKVTLLIYFIQKMYKDFNLNRTSNKYMLFHFIYQLFKVFYFVI